jgi:hypothetical protein
VSDKRVERVQGVEGSNMSCFVSVKKGVEHNKRFVRQQVVASSHLLAPSQPVGFMCGTR